MRFIYTGRGSIHNSKLLQVFSSLYSYAIWNLDFFRGVYKPFCLHPDLSMLQVICLDLHCRGVPSSVDIHHILPSATP